MIEQNVVPSNRQSILTDHFFYFFLRLRKGTIRKEVEALNARYPQETLEQRGPGVWTPGT